MGIGPLHGDGGLPPESDGNIGQMHKGVLAHTAREAARPSSAALAKLAALADRVIKVEQGSISDDSRQARIESLRQKAASGFYDKPDVVKEIARRITGDC